MLNVKKMKKVGTAIAGSALLVGATLTGAAAASHGGSSGDGMTTLGDYPHPFIDDDGTVQSSIVVGDDAKTADVVGAIDIAGSLGQDAYMSEPVSGSDSASAAFDGEVLDEEVIGSFVTGSVDRSDASYFARKTVQDDDGNDVFVTESASINGIESRINGTSTDLNIGNGQVVYQAKFSPGVTVNDTVPIMGQAPEITGIDPSSGEVDLGLSKTVSDMQVDETFQQGPYTVKVEGGNADDSQILVQISRDGEVIESGQLKSDETLETDDEDFKVEAETAFYNTGSEEWSIELTGTYSQYTLEPGEPVPMAENYDLQGYGVGAEGLTSLVLVNNLETVDEPGDEEETDYIENGESFNGPAGFFQVQNRGLSDEAMTDVEFGTDQEVTFEDVNNQEFTFEMTELTTGADPAEDDYVGVAGEDTGSDDTMDYYPVEVASTGSTVNLVHNEFDEEVSFDDSSTNEVSGITISDTSGDSSFYGAANKNYTTDNTDIDVHYRTVDTGYGFSVTVEWIDVDQDGYSSSDPVNVYSGEEYVTPALGVENSDAAAAAKVTTENGAELSQTTVSAAPGIEVSGGGNADIPDVSTDQTDETVVALDEDAGTKDYSGDGEHVYVVYEDGTSDYSDADSGEIGEVAFASTKIGTGSNNDPSFMTDVEDGDSALTNFGSEVELESESGVNVVYPDEQRHQEIGLGMPGAGAAMSGDSEGAVSQTPTGWPSSAMLDTSENVDQARQNDNLILVGGPAINDLTEELATDNQTWSANEWRTGGYEDTSLLQLTNGFEGGNALVVAGHAAEDTQVAADFLANYESHSDALEGQESVQISTETGSVVE